MANVLHVVGDGFNGFIDANPDVVAVSELHRRLAEGGVLNDTTLVIGQGVASEQLVDLRHALGQPANAGIALDVDERQFAIDPRITHKHKEHNVLVSVSECVEAEKVYESLLRIDDRCAEMSDHVTGQHVQGTVLMEAARQMFIAVTEQHFTGSRTAGNYFVINTFEVTFLSFAFPLRTSVRYTIVEHRSDPRGTDFFEALVAFQQNDKMVATVKVSFTVYPQQFIANQEARRARQALRRVDDQPLAPTGS
jgi:hypothetical protein